MARSLEGFAFAPLVDVPEGTLEGPRVAVAAGRGASALHSKGNHGTPVAGGGLSLSLVEATYLVEGGRLKVRDGAHLVRLDDLLLKGAAAQERFEVLYLVYRDLRERGFVVREQEAASGFDLAVRPRGAPAKAPSKSWVLARAEAGQFVAAEVEAYAARATSLDKQALVSVVDEEGDITHYAFGTGLSGPAGARGALPRVEGVLSANHVLVAGEGATALHGADPRLGKALKGIVRLSLIEAAFLALEGRLLVAHAGARRLPISAEQLVEHAKSTQPDFAQRLAVYQALRERGLEPKTGFKYGAHFRVYDSSAGAPHARYLVQAVAQDFSCPWPELARAVRLAHGVRKRLVLAIHRGKGASFLEVTWTRP